tara:strand:- start:189 stop:749 length:561 start_codon:yes stop_codon:yes gene_type:complete
MKNMKFNQTRLDLSEFGLKISLDFNALIREISVKNNVSYSLENNILEGFGHIYLVNQYFLKKIEKLESFLHEGFLNQDRGYFESDFTIIKTMLKVSLFKIRSSQDFCVPLYLSIEELELKLAVQLQKLILFSSKVPAVYASNYQSEISVVSGMKLDIYQFIFFAMKHTQHYLNQIQTLTRSHNILN